MIDWRLLKKPEQIKTEAYTDEFRRLARFLTPMVWERMDYGGLRVYRVRVASSKFIKSSAYLPFDRLSQPNVMLLVDYIANDLSNAIQKQAQNYIRPALTINKHFELLPDVGALFSRKFGFYGHMEIDFIPTM